MLRKTAATGMRPKNQPVAMPVEISTTMTVRHIAHIPVDRNNDRTPVPISSFIIP